MRYVIALIMLLAAPVQAATLALGGDATMGCTLSLNGEIARGDAQEVGFFLEDYGLLGGGQRLCLNSAGGSFADAVQIAQRLVAQGIGTAVAEGAVCNGACALAFIGGTSAGAPDRRLHPGGRLGFHAPQITDAERAYTRAEVDTAYGVALIALSEVITLQSQSDFDFPASLLAELVATPPQSVRRVDTVADAALWRVTVTPVLAPDLPAKTLTEHACHNAALALWDVPGSAVQSLPEAFVNAQSVTSEGLELTTVYAFADNRARCRLTLTQGAPQIGSAGYPEIGARTAPLTAAMLHDPDRLLADLTAGQTPLAQIVARYTDGAVPPVALAQTTVQTCAPEAPQMRVTNVTEFVNMRVAPSFGARILRQAPKGEVLDLITAEPRFVGPSARRAACQSACSQPDQTAERAACITDNVLWHHVRAGGQTGWISRKYLGAP
ncbi:hypothetical protein [Tropicibacter naphthalenivorans]|uniref:SH3b domain-containing protein n=1 Tax=Tropicibacter naphthalenivorans TaxID=441103 RepID=A0A0N7LYJ2_9RHOB|nr:hypothetical protein [Tropicibacter naphthalenivorans]CUH75017.1 hypothetical protein TRN7648_00207 [Tropicibacter naphthalenivorans]SMC47344.1 hypothetical protein SAMN04488093_101673 [Tropicibacter naphthalenivorans]